ncbi:SP_1767 family glycosyltransferase [uncultured Clostridium sp.]|uniref:SP_1767 family glycosyltransferase n=1 Tax=uncultured Clostridium sp. TaxID=59620 RepID=UPI0025931B9C|nr:SP_1767 family glycosyltransferase [uncultured Clostridium sp.]
MKIKQVIFRISNNILKKVYKFKILNRYETVNLIKKNKLSVARFGDGELFIINNTEIGFQEKNIELSKRLEEILKSDDKDILICIPSMLNDTNWCTEKCKKYWDNHLQDSRIWWFKYINKNRTYGDTQITRPYIDLKDKNESKNLFNNLKEIWDNRDVVIIEGEQTRLGVGNDLFNNIKSIKRIICPTKNAFNKYNYILDEAKTLSKDKLILIALGPTATVLAYDLNKLGYEAIDVGHIDVEYEWFLQKVTEKVKLKNKYVNEGTGDINISNENDISYNEEIMKLIL